MERTSEGPSTKQRVTLPRPLRKEIAAFARSLIRDHRTLFTCDPNLCKRVGQFLTALQSTSG